MSAYPYSTSILVPAGSRNLTVLSTVKEELGITDNSSDAALSRMITEQSVAAATYCDRQFSQETIVDSFRLSSSTDYLILSRRPTTSVVSVVDDGSTLVAADYELVSSRGQLWRLDGSDVRQDWGAVKVVVTHVSGYQLLATLPHDIERAVIEMIKQAWTSKGRDPSLRRVIVEGVGERNYTTTESKEGIPPLAASLLEPYRMVTV